MAKVGGRGTAQQQQQQLTTRTTMILACLRLAAAAAAAVAVAATANDERYTDGLPRDDGRRRTTRRFSSFVTPAHESLSHHRVVVTVADQSDVTPTDNHLHRSQLQSDLISSRPIALRQLLNTIATTTTTIAPTMVMPKVAFDAEDLPPPSYYLSRQNRTGTASFNNNNNNNNNNKNNNNIRKTPPAAAAVATATAATDSCSFSVATSAAETSSSFRSSPNSTTTTSILKETFAEVGSKINKEGKNLLLLLFAYVCFIALCISTIDDRRIVLLTTIDQRQSHLSVIDGRDGEEEVEEFCQELVQKLVPKSTHSSSWETSMPKPDEEGPMKHLSAGMAP
ncbi:unnamed protein product [Soboliphyme baturini]|uniref:Uncharacterized protein n=1 Tax=Soboliphyme baturini TaxID=241478 RepID=A0A183IHK5_9BILA|nr:unnamed protein product [Soboliphyme baturini]